MALQSDEISDEENGNNSDIDPIEVAIDAGTTLSKPAMESSIRGYLFFILYSVEHGNLILYSDSPVVRMTVTQYTTTLHLQALQFLENAKFTSTKANTNNEKAVPRPRPLGKETQHALGIA